MKFFKFLLVLSLLVGFTTTASALSVGGLFRDAGLTNLFTDDSAEWLINENGSDSTSGDSTVDTGDRIRAVFQIDHLNATAIGSGTVYNELTGIVDLTASVVFDGANFQYTFTPTPSAKSGFSSDDVFIQLYEDSAKDFTRLGTKAAMEASATGGTLRMVVGDNGDDDFWTATAVTNDVLVIKALDYPINGGTGNFGLTVLENYFPNLIVLEDRTDFFGNKHDVLGSTNFLGTQFDDGTPAGTDADIFDNTDFSIATDVVPEPTTIALFGFGLLGLAGIARRKNS
jgi:hypothetical protein